MKIKKLLHDLWWATGIPGRRLMSQIIEGTCDNLDLLSQESNKIHEEWPTKSFDERKAEIRQIFLGEMLKEDSDMERSGQRADFYLDLLLEHNPALEMDNHVWVILIERRMTVAKRKRRKEQKCQKKQKWLNSLTCSLKSSWMKSKQS